MKESISVTSTSHISLEPTDHPKTNFDSFT